MSDDPEEIIVTASHVNFSQLYDLFMRQAVTYDNGYFVRPGNPVPAPDSPWHIEIIVAGTNLKVKIAQESWNALNDNQRAMILQAISNPAPFSDLARAFAFLEAQGVNFVQINVAAHYLNANGTIQSYVPETVNGVNYYPLMNIQIDYVLNSSPAIIVTGRPAIININSLHDRFLDLRLFATGVIHEFLHPYTPDVYDSEIGQYDDAGPADAANVSSNLDAVYGNHVWTAPPPGPIPQYAPFAPRLPGGGDNGGGETDVNQ